MIFVTRHTFLIGTSVRVNLPSRWSISASAIAFLLALPGVAEPSGSKPDSGHLTVFSGVVRDANGPVSGATVRLQTSPIFTTTDTNGSFTLTVAKDVDVIVLTASAPGFYIGGGFEHRPGAGNIEIRLERHCETDHSEYRWVSAFSRTGDQAACENCHSEPGHRDSELPFDQWRYDAHASSVQNTRFLTMYLGTDIHGNRSPPTRFHESRDYGRIPIRPNTDRPYYGPGYKLDFPTTAGNCATCHAPMAAINAAYSVDPSTLKGVEAEGIGCDFCHKVWDVVLDPDTWLPYDNRPGVLSFVFRRPDPGHQLFTGPLDDVAPGEDVYSPVQKESRYCAPCHSARFWDVEIYSSYDEWLASPYANADSQITCQDCHMPSGLNNHFALYEEGGRQRDPDTIFGHRMPGAGDVTLLQNAVTMTTGAELRDNDLEVRVEIVNDRTGHHVPSDSPLRQLILIVQATDDHGVALDLRDGPTLPDWCGIGQREDGYFAGLPGTAYAKILEELWTGVSPTGAYWTQTRIVSDNRIAAYDSVETTYLFEPPIKGSATIDIRLLYRRAFIELRELKGWDGEDIEMARRTFTVSRDVGKDFGLTNSE